MTEATTLRASGGGAGRGARGGRKVKAPVGAKPPHPAPTTLPRLVPTRDPPPPARPSLGRTASNSNNNNNNNSTEHLQGGDDRGLVSSPHARELGLARAPRPPPPRPPSPATTTGPPEPLAAWSTPREPPAAAIDDDAASSGGGGGGALTSYFATIAPDGAAATTTTTPARLRAVEESLRTTDALYSVDLARLASDNAKFFEILATATQHVEALQHGDLPALDGTVHETRAAIEALTTEIGRLHEQHAAAKAQLLDDFDRVFTQHTEERLALVDAHLADKQSLEDTHATRVRELQAAFDAQLAELEVRYGTMERTCLDELHEVKARAAAELAATKTTAATERAALEASAAAELQELRATSEAAYASLERTSRDELDALRTTSQAEMARVVAAAASDLANVTESLTTQLRAAQAQASAELSRLQEDYAREREELVTRAAAERARLECEHADAIADLEATREREIRGLEDQFAEAQDRHAREVEELTTRYSGELDELRTTSEATRAALVQAHADELAGVRAQATAELTTTVATYESRLVEVAAAHAAELRRTLADAATQHATLTRTHQSELTAAIDENRRERDRLVLSYESAMDALRQATSAQLDRHTAATEEQIRQMREAHAGRVLGLETAHRELERRTSDERVRLEGELAAATARGEALERAGHELQVTYETTVERAREAAERHGLTTEEHTAALVALTTRCAHREATIEDLRRQLQASDEAGRTKAGTILELTFVIQSRDEEIERLRAALLDSTQRVNTKAEILELTAESLSTKARELEEAKSALRLESSRLSMVEEEMHQKEGQLEDTELKMETLRLKVDGLRLELKRLQLELQLQHEHSEGEMELKNGELRRLHAAHNELRSKSTVQQETIVRLEDALQSATRHGDELARRLELLKLEATQGKDALADVRAVALEREHALNAFVRTRDQAVAESRRLQLQVGHLQHGLQVERERGEGDRMRLEDLDRQYQRLLEMTAAEKDARMRSTHNLLALELAAAKELARQYEGLDEQLRQSREIQNATATTAAALAEEKQRLLEQVTRLAAELSAREAAIRRADAEREDLGRQLAAETTARHEDAARRDDEVARLEEEQRLAREVRATLETQLATSELALEAARSELAALHSRLASIDAISLEVESERTSLREEIAALSAEREALEAENRELVAQRDARAADCDRLGAEMRLSMLQHQRERQEAAVARTVEAVIHHTLVRDSDERSRLAREAWGQQRQQLEETAAAERRATDSVRAALDEVRAELAFSAQELAVARSSLEAADQALAEREQQHIQELSDLRDRAEEKAADARSDAAVRLSAMVEERTALVAAHANELENQAKTLQKAMETQGLELQAAFEAKIAAAAAAMAAASSAADDARETLIAEHERRVQDLESRFGEDLAQTRASLAEAEREVARLASALEATEGRYQGQVARVTELETALSESQEVLRVRKATIENVRKELNLLMQERGLGGGGGTAESPPHGLDPTALALLRQQLETFAHENYDVELDKAFADIPPTLDVPSLAELLRGLVRIRCVGSGIGRASRVRTVDEICATVRAMDQIADAASGDAERVVATWREHQQLVGQLQRVLLPGATESASAEGLLSAVQVIEAVLARLFHGDDAARPPIGSVLDLEGRCCDALAILADYASACELARNTAPETIDETHAPALTLTERWRRRAQAEEAMLAHARVATACESITSLGDLAPLLTEAQGLRAAVASVLSGGPIVGVHLESSNHLRSLELIALLREHQALVAGLSVAFGLPSSSAAPSPLPLTTAELIDAANEVVRVLAALESLQVKQPTHHSDSADGPPRPLVARAAAVHAFVEELRMIAQFAQTILEQESEATSGGEHSHTSSASSLGVLRALTRTPTPTEDLDARPVVVELNDLGDEEDHGALPLDSTLEAELMLDDDALRPLSDDFGGGGGPPDALSDSLMDISLVMSDHQRIIAEAAHWVGKAGAMSRSGPRQRSADDDPSGGIDFSSELGRLVREHCALLSLAKRLFRLRDPRRDLTPLLECLAIVTRLTSRLHSFDRSPPPSETATPQGSRERLPPGDSDVDAASEDRPTTPRAEDPGPSLSVFALMEELARRLQDYEYLVQHLSRETPWLRAGARAAPTDTIESLASAISDRVIALEGLGSMLGLAEPISELPVIIRRLQEVVELAIAQRNALVSAGEDDTEGEDIMDGIDPVQGPPISTTPSLETTLLGLDFARADLESGHRLAHHLRETLPFARGLRSPDELMLRVSETFEQSVSILEQSDAMRSQLDELGTRNRELAAEVEAVNALLRQSTSAWVEHAPPGENKDERLPPTTTTSASRRLELLQSLVHERVGLRARNAAMAQDVNDATRLLHEHGFIDGGNDNDDTMTITDAPRPTAWLEAMQRALAGLAASRTEVQATQARIDAEIREETEFLVDRGLLPADERAPTEVADENGPLRRRLRVYDTLLAARDAAAARDRALEAEREAEAAYLRAQRLAFDPTRAAESRMAVYDTLLQAQNALIDEKMERELELQRARAAISERLGLDDVDSVTALTTHLLTLREHLDAVEREAERDRALLRAHGVDASAIVGPAFPRADVLGKLLEVTQRLTAETQDREAEREFLAAQGIRVDPETLMTAVGRRERVYDAFLERIADAESRVAQWAAGPHTDPEVCRRAEADHIAAIERLREELASQATLAVAEAVERETHRVAIREAAAGGVVQHSICGGATETASGATAVIGELLEALTKRDNAAIAMIYRLIRLATDILNSSMFANTAPGGSGGGGEIPVELTQAVLACVKELRALKEFLIQSLEALTRRAHDATAPPLTGMPAFLAINGGAAIADRETAIDFALGAHREFVAFANQLLAAQLETVRRPVAEVLELLATHGGGFSDPEKQLIERELALATVTSEKTAVETMLAANDEFHRRFADERRAVEAELRRAIAEAQGANATLEQRLAVVEKERDAAKAQVVGVGFGLPPGSSSTPSPLVARTPMTPGIAFPTRPERPRPGGTGTTSVGGGGGGAGGSAHKERFISDLEKETGQRRTSTALRRANDWRRHELLSSSAQLESQFRAMDAAMPPRPQLLTILHPPADTGGGGERAPVGGGDQELWYQGARVVQHVSFFVSIFRVPKQSMYRVEVFNSDTEQAQTIYVTDDELRAYVRDNKRASHAGLEVDDVGRRGEVVDVLFERVRVLGEGTANLLLSFD